MDKSEAAAAFQRLLLDNGADLDDPLGTDVFTEPKNIFRRSEADGT